MRDILDYKAIGLRIKELRITQGYTQETFSEAVEVSPSFIGHIERGEKKCSLETINRIAIRLGTTMDYLILGLENRCNQQSCRLYAQLRKTIDAYDDEKVRFYRDI